MIRSSRPNRLPASLAAGLAVSLFLFTGLSVSTLGQASQLSLSDILVGLRSKKLTLPERNKILADAIRTRGTTFGLTSEIEKELSGGGADSALIESVRQRLAMVRTAPRRPAVVAEKAVAPIESETAEAIEKRGQAKLAAADHDGAIIDFTHVIERNPELVGALYGRAKSYFAKGLFTLASADLGKFIELSPKNDAALSMRAEIYERKGIRDLADADYRRAYELNPENVIAKQYVLRIEAEQVAIRAEAEKAKVLAQPVPTAVIPPPVVTPEFIDLGVLTESRAVRMVKPIYSDVAVKARAAGRVEVSVQTDTEGNVISAKATSGHSFLRQNSEEAARKSKFRPAIFDGKPVKGRGVIIYNFVVAR